MTQSLHTTSTHTGSSETTTMKAIVQHAYGSADVLTLEDVVRPEITDNDVLIRVRAAAVNHAD